MKLKKKRLRAVRIEASYIEILQRDCAHERSGDNPSECGKCGKFMPPTKAKAK